MNSCIIRNEKNFEVKILNKEENYPSNYVLIPQERNTGSSSFQMVENDIRVVWTHGTQQGHWVNFFMNDVKIKSIPNPQIQSVCDYLNKFAKIETQELNELLIEVQKNTKINLEIEIDKLKNELKSLKEEKLKLNNIKLKINELIILLNEIN